MCVPLMSSPIGRSTSRRAAASPCLMGARTVKHWGGMTMLTTRAIGGF
jgi:hypothetical protein